MSKLEINISELKNNKADIEKKITELEGLNQRLSDLINRMEDSWSGEASKTYINKMRGYLDQAKNLVKVYEEFKKYADSAANEFETLDKECASSVRGSF